ncbi:cytochrome P450 4C1-like isoform X2 [Rhodnius prolixus]
MLMIVKDVTKSFFNFLIQLPTWIRIFWMLYKLPGPPATFLLGHARAFLSMYKFMGIALKWQEEFPLFHKAYLMFYPLVMVYAPEAVQLVLSTKQKHLDKGKIYDTLLPMLGEGLITCKAAKWSRRRKLLTPAFHFNILETFFQVFQIRSNDFIEELKKGGITKQYKDICPFAKNLTLNIICETALGLPNEERKEQIEIVKAMQRLEEIAMYRCIYPWLLCDWVFKLTRAYRTHERKIHILNNFTDKVIKKRQEVLQTELELENDNTDGEKKNAILIDILLKLNSDGQSLRNEDIREEIKTFMFAGHNTTYLAISYCIYLLGRYPEVQKNAIEEVDTIFGDSKRDPTMDDLKQLKYLDRCIRDTLRLYPSVPVIGRRSSEDQPIGEYVIPKNSDVIIIPYIIHRNPKQFPDPERFNPDNFLPENVKGRHPYSYIPFSAGPRNCIGKRFADLVMLIAISWVLREFTIHSLHKQEDLKVLPKTILEPVHGLQVKLTPRR